MPAEHIELKDKPGIEELDHRGELAIIANRVLYDHGKAHKFTVVDKDKAQLDDVFLSHEKARSEMRSKSNGN
jgi:hypothetical protein